MSLKPSGLASLTAQYTDSEEEGSGDEQVGQEAGGSVDATPNSDDGKQHLTVPTVRSLVNPISRDNSPLAKWPATSGAPGSPEYENGIIEDDDRPSSPVSFHKTLEGLTPDQIEIPPEPRGQCPRDVVAKVALLHEKMLQGQNMNALMQSRKSFRNPSIYEKLIAFSGIDEFGTNYPSEMYDPHKWGPTSYYEELREQQKQEMDRFEKEKRDRTKVEFVTGTVKKPAPTTGSGDQQPKSKKSKWDSAPAPSAVAAAAVASVLPKPTVISAYGPIKPKK